MTYQIWLTFLGQNFCFTYKEFGATFGGLIYTHIDIGSYLEKDGTQVFRLEDSVPFEGKKKKFDKEYTL